MIRGCGPRYSVMYAGSVLMDVLYHQVLIVFPSPNCRPPHIFHVWHPGGLKQPVKFEVPQGIFESSQYTKGVAPAGDTIPMVKPFGFVSTSYKGRFVNPFTYFTVKVTMTLFGTFTPEPSFPSHVIKFSPMTTGLVRILVV